MAMTIENLEIQIEANANTATSGIDALSKSLGTLRNAGNRLTPQNNKLSFSFLRLGKSITASVVNLSSFLLGINHITDVLSAVFQESNEYIESMNLFKIAMGDATEEALEYAQTVERLMGIDLAEWIENQGVFMRMGTGFGVSADKAALMSKNLTQLGYDMASFFNADVETAMSKIQSGMTGQIKGLKAWGYNLSVAALQETALSLGIEQSVRTMSEAQKAQLRYITLIQKSTGIMGDMARTITTPANAMRILGAQSTKLRRELGKIVSIIAVQVIPWMQALVQIVTEAAAALAAFFGYKESDFDFSDVDLELGSDMEESLDDATTSVKELKRQLLGIDELNIFDKNDTSSGTEMPNYDLGVELPEYDFLAGLPERTDELKERLKEILNNYVLPIAAGLALWNVAKFLSQVNTVIGSLKQMTSEVKGLASVATIILEFQLVKKAANDFLSDDGTIKDLIMQAVYATLGSSILYALWGTGGIAMGMGVAITAIFSSLYSKIASGGLDHNDPRVFLEQALASVFGGIAGFALGGPIGAMIGMSVSFAVGLNLETIAAVKGGQIQVGTKEYWLSIIEGALAAGLAGAMIGFAIGGPGGAAIGFLVGAGVSFTIQTIATNWSTIKENFSTWWDGIKQDSTRKASEFKTQWDKDWEEIRGAWKYVMSGQFGQDLSTWWKQTVSPWFTAEKWKKIGSDAINGLWDGLKGIWANLKSWWSKLELPSFKIKKPHLSWSTQEAKGITAKILSAIGLPTSLPKLNVSWYANGGFPDMGEMFIAREAGPELVGRIGNKTTVANNDQIVDGIASGVRTANEDVVTAIYSMAQRIITTIEENGGDVYLDGARVGQRTTEVQNRRNRMYGKALSNA